MLPAAAVEARRDQDTAVRVTDALMEVVQLVLAVVRRSLAAAVPA